MAEPDETRDRSEFPREGLVHLPSLPPKQHRDPLVAEPRVFGRQFRPTAVQRLLALAGRLSTVPQTSTGPSRGL